MASATDNLISITITAIDQASEVIAGITAQIEDAQKALTDSATTTTADITATNDELAANFQEMSDSVTSSLGEIAIANDSLVADMDTLVADVDSRNAMIIASFTAMKDSIAADMTDIGLSEKIGFESGNLGNLGLGGLGSLTGLSAGGSIALAGAAAAAFSVYEAANFQQSLTRLYTTAGETANKGQLGAGISAISTLTGQNVIDLTSGKNGQAGAMYYISSAGYNGMNGLQVLRPVAQASAMEGANPADVANALTTMMRDYGASGKQGTSFMDMLLTAVSRGKTTLQQTATALPSFLTSASAAGLSPANVLAYYSTLTGAGISSQQSGQDVNALIRELSGGFTTQESTGLQNLGLNPVNIMSNLSKSGLAQTVNVIEQAILSHMQGGKVLLSAFQNSTVAQSNLQTELAAAPSNVRSLAEQLINGGMSYGAFRQYASILPGRDRSIAEQIATTYNQTQSFNKALTSNKPLAQTYLSENQQIFGQGDARNAAVVGEQNMQTTIANQKAIQDSSKSFGNDVKGWSLYIGTMNAQMHIFWQNILAVARDVGGYLLPPVTTFFRLMNDAFSSGILTKVFEVMIWPIIETKDAIDLLKSHWQGISNLFSSDWQQWGKDVKGWWGGLQGDFNKFGNALTGWFSGIFDGIVNGFTSLPSKIGDAIKKGAKGLASGASSVVSSLGKDVTGFFSSIPGLASGTTYAQGGLTLVGENGPELVQMPAGARVYNDSQTSAILNGSAASLSAGGGGGMTVNLSVNVGNYLGSQADHQRLAKQIYQSLQNIARQHGAASSLPNIGILPQ